MDFYSNPAPAQSNTLTNLFQTLETNYPDLFSQLSQASNANILPQAQAELGASQATSAPYAQLMTQLLGEYMPQLAQIGSQTGEQTQQNQANANATVANSAGGQDALNAAISADQTANPQFYATRAADSNSLNTLLSNDTSALSGQLNPSEMTAIGQSVAQQGNQTGTFNTPSAVQTTANAMNYGNAVYNRQEQAKSDLSSALGQATSFLPASQSGVGGMNAFNIATGGDNTATNSANTATGLFTGVNNTANNTSSSASMAGNTLSGMLGTGTGVADTTLSANASQPTTEQGLTGMMSSMS